MFVHEAKLAVRLSHANIVQVFDLGRVDRPSGEPTSLLHGDGVRAGARPRHAPRALPPAEARSCPSTWRCTSPPRSPRPSTTRTAGATSRRARSASSTATSRRRTSSLSWEGEVKVTDFGIAKAHGLHRAEDEDADARAGRVRGKLAYMSPEQARAEPVDGRSDLFSLGTVLYEMLAGAEPVHRADLVRDAAPRAGERVPAARAAPPRRADGARGHRARSMLAQERGRALRRRRAAPRGSSSASSTRRASASAPTISPSSSRASTRTQHAGELESGSVFDDEQTGANERTPVEVPQRQRADAPRTGTSARPPIRHAGGASTGRSRATGELGERREVTALVRRRFGRASRARRRRRRARQRVARAREVLGALRRPDPRGGAGADRRRIFGLGDADGRDTEAAVRAALVILRAPRRRRRGLGGRARRRASSSTRRARPSSDERLASLVAAAQALARATEGRRGASRPLAAPHHPQRVRHRGAARRGRDRRPRAAAWSPRRGRPPRSYGRFVGRHDELKRLGDILARATRRARAARHASRATRASARRACSPRWSGACRRATTTSASTSRRARERRRGPVERRSPRCSSVLCGIQEGDDEERILDVLPRLRALGLQDDESRAVLAPARRLARERAPRAARDVERARCAPPSRAWCRASATIASTSSPGTTRRRWTTPTLEAIARAASTAARRACAGPARGVPPRDARARRRRRSPTHPRAPRAPARRAVRRRQRAPHRHARRRAHPAARAARASAASAPGGHPLFLEELVKELHDSGAISVHERRGEGAPRRRHRRPAHAAHAHRRARRAASTPAERAALQAAAILGDPVPHRGARGACSRQNLAQVDRAIAASPRGISCASTGAAAGELRLADARARSCSTPSRPRRGASCTPAAAAAYVSAVGDDGVEHAERIAQHLYQAGDRDRAATFFAQAALHARAWASSSRPSCS